MTQQLTPNRLTPSEAARQLALAMSDNGYPISGAPIGDGAIHRFYVMGDKKRTLNGWYAFFLYPVPAAAYGSWKTQEKFTWSAVQKRDLTETQQGEYRRLMESAKRQQEEKRLHEQRCVADEATAFFERLPHDVQLLPYMTRKNVDAYGLRRHGELVVVPVCDIDGNITSLQFISSDGSKRFKRGGRVSGCFHLIGEIDDILYICEGYATGATIHQETGLPAVIAFFAGNIEAVACGLRNKHPDALIIIAADNDRFTPGNPGLTKAFKAAKATRAELIVPKFNDDEPGTDWNDWVNNRGGLSWT